MIKNFFFFTLGNLRYRKLRSALTILGITIGVAMILTLQLLGRGLRSAVRAQLQQLGPDIIFVLPGEEGNPLAAVILGETLREKDAEAIRQVPGVEMAMPIVEKVGIMEFGGEQKTVNLHAQPVREMVAIFEGSQGFRLAEGRWLESEYARETVVADKIAHKRFDQPVRVGDEITLKGRRFTVVGILKPIGEETHDRSVFISETNFRSLTGIRDSIRSIMVKAKPGVAVADLADDIRYRLERQVGLERFSVFTSDKAERMVGDIIGIIELVLAAIASVAVVVGGIGIMNTMFMTVMERTRDIGVMKAVGASHRDILFIFLMESGLLGLLGGFLGSAIGSALAIAAGALAKSRGFELLDVAPDPALVAEIILIALFFGIASGVLPARRAALLDPVEALRYE